MNVFRKFALRTMKKNPSRTLVTVIGIILSMSMFTAVAEAAYSGMQFLIRNEIANSGSWHVMLTQLSADALASAQKDPNVKDSTAVSVVGWADGNTKNDYKPYILVKAVDDDFGSLVKIRLTEGRMPENDGEILLPAHLRQPDNGGVEFRLGDRIGLALGDRVAGNESLPEREGIQDDRPESIVGQTVRTYTVVGVYERFSFDVETTVCPGYTALTRRGASDAPSELFCSLKRPGKIDDFIRRYDGNARMHTNLLQFEGKIRDSGIRATVYGFMAVLFALIVFGSVSLIYNAFAISVSERTKQYGLLKSVGATKKQIRSAVLSEAFMLALIGIPLGAAAGCGGIGVTFYLLRDSFTRMLTLHEAVPMRMIPYVPALALAAVLCLGTILLSAYIPARRAMRLDPISSIRSSTDVTLTARDVKTGGLLAKLFGFEGMLAAKNFRRSRRRYRAVVLSLFMSVVLFVSASSLCSYLGKTFSAYDANDVGCDLVYMSAGCSDAENAALLTLFRETDGVESVAAANVSDVELLVPRDALSRDQLDNLPAEQNQEDALRRSVQMIFLDEDTFRAVCTENGVDPAPYLAGDGLRALVYDEITTREITEEGNSHFSAYREFRDGALPLQTEITSLHREFDGLIYFGPETDENGETVYLYYEESYLQALPVTESPDPARGIRKTAGEATYRVGLELSETIRTLPFRFDGSSSCVLLPVSAKARLLEGLPEDLFFVQTAFLIGAPAHRAVADVLRTALTAMSLPTERLSDLADQKEMTRTVVTVINVFAYGFITLISLIAAANVFNTISTNIALRRREIAMLRSIGLSQKSFRKMMNVECLIYGFRGLLTGLPVSVLLSFLFYLVAGLSVDFRFYLPWQAVVIAVASVFLVVFATMLYAAAKIRKDDPVEALRNENL